jgi:hypothetical protein
MESDTSRHSIDEISFARIPDPPPPAKDNQAMAIKERLDLSAAKDARLAYLEHIGALGRQILSLESNVEYERQAHVETKADVIELRGIKDELIAIKTEKRMLKYIIIAGNFLSTTAAFLVGFGNYTVTVVGFVLGAVGVLCSGIASCLDLRHSVK